MNYYILLPKPIIKPCIVPEYTTMELNPYISPSVHYYLNDIKLQINKLKCETHKVYNSEYIFNLINPYDFIFCELENEQHVSLLKTNTLLYYNFLEVDSILNIMNTFYNTHINILLDTNENDAIKMYIQTIKKEKNNIYYEESISISDDFNDIELKEDYVNKMNIMIYEITENTCNDIKKYIKILLHITYNIVNYQASGGICVIKLTQIYYKPVLDLIYMLSSFFNKTYICKPHISYQEERFIVFEKYLNNHSDCDKSILINKISELLKSNRQVKSIIPNHIPNYVLNKIEDSNIIIGYHSLDHYNELINICKSKNIIERIDAFKKNSISKSIQWCSSHNIPYDKDIIIK